MVSKTKSASVDMPTIPKAIKRAKQPFAKGGLRLALSCVHLRRGYTCSYEGISSRRWRSIRHRSVRRNNMYTSHSCRICYQVQSHLGWEWKIGPRVHGIMACAEDMDGKQRYFSYIWTVYWQWLLNSNTGFVTVESHWHLPSLLATIHAHGSNQKLVVCRVKKGSKVIFTDLAIRTVYLQTKDSFRIMAIFTLYREGCCALFRIVFAPPCQIWLGKGGQKPNLRIMEGGASRMFI